MMGYASTLTHPTQKCGDVGPHPSYACLYEQHGLPIQEQMKRKTNVTLEHKNEK